MNQYELNKEIEAFITKKDKQKTSYTKKDIEYISQYAGYGGLAKFGAKGRAILDEYYTPPLICEKMFEKAKEFGYKKGSILEPACGAGNFIEYLPTKDVTAFEINKFAIRIAEIKYPKATFYSNYLETAFLSPDKEDKGEFNEMLKKSVTWLKSFPFSLVIGNPPYGQNKNYYTGRLRGVNFPKIAQMEIAFIWYALRLLKSGGLVVYISGTNFLSNGTTYHSIKEKIGEKADLLTAYRLPPVFKTTGISTDIIILQKK